MIRLSSPMSVLALLLALSLSTAVSAAPAASTDAAAIEWREWGKPAFAEAKASGKPVYLYLEAVWCHWCHVMQQTTLTDPAVVQRLNEDFVPVRADHDAMPALANRYRAWGWPAQIWISPEGDDLVRKAGYADAEIFGQLMDRALNSDPATPSSESADVKNASAPNADSGITPDLRQRLMAKHRRAHDEEEGGLALAQKFLDADSVELDMLLARQGDQSAAARAQQTLDGALALIDPAWGGAYQYSTHGVWSRPHFEKIMLTQAAFLRVYAQAYVQFGKPEYLNAGQAVRAYLEDFLLSPDGGFYTSQDADLEPGKKAHAFFALDAEGRAARGMPRIDRNRYAQHNGLAIEGLALWYAASGDQKALRLAENAARWVQENLEESGGYRHEKGKSAAGRAFYLADKLAMARAWLALYKVTADRDDLQRAIAAADVIQSKFSHGGAGFTGEETGKGPLQPRRDVDENISVTRFFNLLGHYSGRERHAQAALHGMSYLSRPSVALKRIDESGVLLADHELSNAPVHATVVGPKDNEKAGELFAVLLRTPGWYKRLEWWDRREGPLPHTDVQYPGFEQPAGYYCEAKRCSAPQFEPDRFRRLVDERSRSQAES